MQLAAARRLNQELRTLATCQSDHSRGDRVIQLDLSAKLTALLLRVIEKCERRRKLGRFGTQQGLMNERWKPSLSPLSQ